MEINILRGDLFEGLKNIQTIVEKRTTLPILNNFLLSTKEEGIEISATDLEIEYKGFYPAKVLNSGSIVLPTRKSFEIVRETFGTSINISTEENWAKIQLGKSVFKIPGLPDEEFPKFSEKKPTISLELETKVIKDMINKTIFATSQEEVRSVLGGVLLSLKVDNISMIATDGYRLALVNREVDISGLEKSINAIIPKKVLLEMRKVFPDSEENLSLGLYKNGVVFKSKNIILSSRLLEGEFPDYKQVIPERNEKRLVFKRDDFSQALRKVSLMSDEESRLITMKLRLNQIELLSITPGLGEAHDEIDVTYSDEEMEICFNARYLMEGLDVFEEEYVVCELQDTNTAIIIKPLEKQYCFNIIMPMHID